MEKAVWILWVMIGLLSPQRTTPFLIHYENDYDQPLDFQCQGNTTLHYLSSHHNNHHEDRVWALSCRAADGYVNNCAWSGYVNNYDDPVLFECTGDSFINGIQSVHDNHHEDRRWNFLCCQMNGFVRSNCEFSGYVNSYDNDLVFNVSSGHVIHGINSFHDNSHEDRIFAFETCEFTL